MTTPLLSVSIEGCDEEGFGQVGQPLSLILEGALPEGRDASKYEVLIAPENKAQNSNNDLPNTAVRLSVADFLEDGGPFLCQIDFTPETVGLMVFNVLLKEGPRPLADAVVGVRILNQTRDSSGNRRPGALRKIKN